MTVYWRSLVEGRRSNPLLLGGLRALSHLYGLGLRCRRRQPVRAGLPVVSVGNVAVGGTGKTPLVMALCEQVKELQVAVWSRFQDEARLIAQRCPWVQVISGPRRSVEGQLLILDDGLQQPDLDVDLQIVVLDGANPWGSGRLLPAGLLREPLQALERAHFVVVTRQLPERFEEQLRRYTAAPWVAMGVEPSCRLQGMRLGALCAIGQPEQFYQMVEGQGAQLVARWSLPDHSAFEGSALERFVHRCEQAGAQAIVCTEKDAVKLTTPLRLPLVPIPIRLKPLANEPVWEALVAKMKFLVQHGPP